jgi:hypothetical protein
VNSSRALTYRRLLRVVDMRALLLAICLSRLAGRMFMLAIVLYALSHAGSPVLAGWLALAAAQRWLVFLSRCRFRRRSEDAGSQPHGQCRTNVATAGEIVLTNCLRRQDLFRRLSMGTYDQRFGHRA